MGNVKPITAGIVLQETAPVPDVVSMLEDMLSRARRGEVRAIALVASAEMEQPVRISGKAGELVTNAHALIGQMFVMQQDLAQVLPR